MATKNVEPYDESEMVNDASQYSNAWSAVKYPPRMIVDASPRVA